jgi:hypothetical protein
MIAARELSGLCLVSLPFLCLEGLLFVLVHPQSTEKRQFKAAYYAVEGKERCHFPNTHQTHLLAIGT